MSEAPKPETTKPATAPAHPEPTDRAGFSSADVGGDPACWAHLFAADDPEDLDPGSDEFRNT